MESNKEEEVFIDTHTTKQYVTKNYQLSQFSVNNGRFFTVIAFFCAITFYVVGHDLLYTHFLMI